MTRQLRDNARSSEPARKVSEIGSDWPRQHVVPNAIPDPIFVNDRDSIFCGCNAAFARLLGLDPAAVMGRADADRLPPEKSAEHGAGDRAAIATGEPRRRDLWSTARAPTRLEDACTLIVQQHIGVPLIAQDATGGSGCGQPRRHLASWWSSRWRLTSCTGCLRSH